MHAPHSWSGKLHWNIAASTTGKCQLKVKSFCGCEVQCNGNCNCNCCCCSELFCSNKLFMLFDFILPGTLGTCQAMLFCARWSGDSDQSGPASESESDSDSEVYIKSWGQQLQLAGGLWQLDTAIMALHDQATCYSLANSVLSHSKLYKHIRRTEDQEEPSYDRVRVEVDWAD